MPVEIGTRLAILCFWLYVQEEGIVWNTKHLCDLWGFPAINFEYRDLFASIFTHHIVIDSIEIGHEFQAKMTLRREKF